MTDTDPYAAFSSPAPAAPPAAAPADPYAAFSSPAPAQTPGVRFAQPSTTEDVAKSAGTGLVKGTTGLVGAPGDVSDGLGNAAEWLLQRGLTATGLAPKGVEPQSFGEIAADNKQLSSGSTVLPRSGDINKAVQSDVGSYYQPQTTAGKYAETAAEFVPGSLAMPGSVPANLAKGAISGLASEAAGQATAGTGMEGPARIVAAIAAPGAVSRAVTPLPINAERAAMVDTLRQEGVPLTAGQVTGNKPLRYAESVLSETPLSGGKAQAMDEAQRAAFTAATLRSLGIDANRATPDVLAGAKAAIGKQFNDVAARNSLTFDPQFGHDIGKTLNDYDSLVLPNQQAPIVQQTVDGLSQLGGTLPGARYQSIRSTLDKHGRAIAQNNPPLSQALFGIRNALDDAMTRSVSPDDAALWQDARQKWKNWKVVEKAATGAGENAAAGNISPAALRSATVAQNRGAYAVGQGDFADLSRSGVGVMSPLPNSGTAPRMMVSNILGGIGALGGAHGAGLEGAISGAMLAGATPAVLSRILMARPTQAYLGNQLLADPGRAGFLERILLANTARQALPSPGAPQVDDF